jgi:hypothetical protein
VYVWHKEACASKLVTLLTGWGCLKAPGRAQRTGMGLQGMGVQKCMKRVCCEHVHMHVSACRRACMGGCIPPPPPYTPRTHLQPSWKLLVFSHTSSELIRRKSSFFCDGGYLKSRTRVASIINAHNAKGRIRRGLVV